MAHTRSLTFGRTTAAPLPIAQELPSEAGDRVPAPEATAFNSLLVYGELGRDADLIQKLLRRLPNQPDDLHGNLQAMLSTAKRLTEKITKFIEAERG